MPEFLIVNPAKRKTAAKRTAKKSQRARTARRKQHNPVPGVLLSMANPKRKKRTTSAAGKRRNPAIKMITRYKNKARKAKTRRNPHTSRNPFNVGGFGLKSIAEVAAGAVAGAAATRSLTAKALGAHNNGPLGYLTNAAVAFGLGFGVAKLTKMPLLGVGIAAGGVGTIYQRFYDENVSKLIPVAALAISGGASDGKGLGDVSYDSYHRGSLEGYYNATYSPRTVLDGPMSAPVAISAGRGVHPDLVA